MDDRDKVYPESADPENTHAGPARPQVGDDEGDTENPVDVAVPTWTAAPPVSERVRILGAEPAAEVTAVLPVVRRDDPDPPPDEASHAAPGAARPGTVRLTGERAGGAASAPEPVRPGETVLPGHGEATWPQQVGPPIPSGTATPPSSNDAPTVPEDAVPVVAAPVAPVLPHWTDPPTGQVPAVLARGDGDRGSVTGPVWREGDVDWQAHDNEYEPAMLVEDEPALGSLDERDAPDSDRRPWEFDLPQDARVAGPGRGVLGSDGDPLVSPWAADDQDRRPGGAGPEQGVGRSVTDRGGERAGTPPKGEKAGDGFLAAPESVGEVLADAGPSEREDADDLPEIGRFRRGGLRSRRPRARRPTNVPEDLEPPLAAEPPGAAITEVPGVGLRRGGIAGLAAADRDAHPDPDAGAGQERRRLRTTRSRRGRRARREESAWWSDAAGGDEEGAAERVVGRVGPEPTGGDPPPDLVSGSVSTGGGGGEEEERAGSSVADSERVPAEPEPSSKETRTSSSEARPRVRGNREGLRSRPGPSGGGPPVPRTRPARRQPGRAGSPTGTSEGGPGSRSGVGIRIATGIVAAAVALALFSAGAVPSLVLVIVVVVFAAGEAFGVLRRAGYRPATLLGLIGIAVLMVGAYTKGPEAVPPILAAIGAFTLLWYLFGVEAGPPVAGAAATLLVVVWIGLLGSFAALLLAPSANPHREGIAFLLGAVIATVANDVGGLLVGGWIGRHPLAPRASPHKTWEGFVGGLVLTVGVSAGLIGAIHPWTPEKAAILGLAVSVVAPLGDLCESLLKRDLLVKDMGNLLPGHGGVLDRIDGMLFVLPVTYYLVHALHLG